MAFSLMLVLLAQQPLHQTEGELELSERDLAWQQAAELVEHFRPGRIRVRAGQEAPGPLPAEKPIGKIKIHQVTRPDQVVAYRWTYYVKVPEGGEGHYRIELATASRNRIRAGRGGNVRGGFAKTSWRRSHELLPAGVTKKERVIAKDDQDIFILLLRTAKTHKAIILDVATGPFPVIEPPKDQPQ